MVLSIGYNCPSCRWDIRGKLEDRAKYVCPVCNDEFEVKWNDKRKKFYLIELIDETKREPLRLPRGTVRASIMLLFAFSCWYLFFTNRDVPSYILNLILVVVAYYFAFRGTAVSHPLQSFSTIDTESEKQPLFLPKGLIRSFIIVGFVMSGLYLVIEQRIYAIQYLEFYFIIAGLIVGFLIHKVTAPFRTERWYTILGHVKAVIILALTFVIVALLISSNDGLVEPLMLRISIASVGFYFGSR